MAKKKGMPQAKSWPWASLGAQLLLMGLDRMMEDATGLSCEDAMGLWWIA